MADRYEINHSGEIVVGESALCAIKQKCYRISLVSMDGVVLKKGKKDHAINCDSNIQVVIRGPLTCIVELSEMRAEMLMRRRFN